MKRNLIRTERIPCTAPVIDTEGPSKGIDFTFYETEYSYWDLLVHKLKSIRWHNLKWKLKENFLYALSKLGLVKCNNCHKFYRSKTNDLRADRWCLKCRKVVEEHMDEYLTDIVANSRSLREEKIYNSLKKEF